MSRSDAEHTTAWQLQSLLLGYPDDEVLGRRRLLRAAAQTLSRPVGSPLVAFLDHVESTALPALQADYVATFDHRRRFSLYLTYFAYGDTRKRGVALLRFKNAYRLAGLELDDQELPDHLAVVLEFAATGDPVAGKRLLTQHRAGLELIRLGLLEARSAWAHVLESISATLPPLGTRDRESVVRLAAEGPPEEEVGLEPFAPPEYMPRAGGRR